MDKDQERCGLRRLWLQFKKKHLQFSEFAFFFFLHFPEPQQTHLLSRRLQFNWRFLIYRKNSRIGLLHGSKEKDLDMLGANLYGFVPFEVLVSMGSGCQFRTHPSLW